MSSNMSSPIGDVTTESVHGAVSVARRGDRARGNATAAWDHRFAEPSSSLLARAAVGRDEAGVVGVAR